MEIVYAVGVFALLCCAGYLTWRHRARQLRRRAHPKDFAFKVAYGWGAEMKLPKIERLRKHMPWISDAELLSWIPELEDAEKFLGPLVEQGGPKVLGQAEVERRIKGRYPFLVEEGLRQALSLVGYHAMHDGHDKQPVRRATGDA